MNIEEFKNAMSDFIAKEDETADKDLLNRAKLTKESLCINKECEPPYGGKDNCEFNNNGICTAKSL